MLLLVSGLAGQSIESIIAIYAIKILKAALVLWIGFYLTKRIVNVVKKIFDKSNRLEPTLEKFILSFLGMALKVLIVIETIKILGADTASIIAVLGAGSFAVGLALQGSLSNFASGMLILFLKPIKVGDYVDIDHHSGTVSIINIFSTELLTVDNKTIIIPNSKVSNATVVNYSIQDERRLDLKFGVSYDADIDKVKSIILEEVNKLPNISTSQKPFVALAEHGSSALIFVLRVWTKKEHYWDLNFALMENVKKAFDNAGIDIPYDVIDVRLPENK